MNLPPVPAILTTPINTPRPLHLVRMSEQVHPSAAVLENEEEEVLREAGVALSLQGLHPSPEQQAPVELLAEVTVCCEIVQLDPTMYCSSS